MFLNLRVVSVNGSGDGRRPWKEGPGVRPRAPSHAEPGSASRSSTNRSFTGRVRAERKLKTERWRPWTSASPSPGQEEALLPRTERLRPGKASGSKTTNRPRVNPNHQTRGLFPLHEFTTGRWKVGGGQRFANVLGASAVWNTCFKGRAHTDAHINSSRRDESLLRGILWSVPLCHILFRSVPLRSSLFYLLFNSPLKLSRLFRMGHHSQFEKRHLTMQWNHVSQGR